MKILQILSVIFLAMLCTASIAMADAQCPESCPEGQVLVTFGDGNNLSCTCVPQGEGMVEGPAGCTGDSCDAPAETEQQNQ